jgi:hypothetical protein
LATYTLRQLLTTQTSIDVDGVTLSNFRNDGPSNISPAYVLIDTVGGDDPGIDIRLDPRVANTAGGAQLGILFEATTAGSILAGASMSLSGYSFAAPEAGGRVDVALTQAPRPVENIGISLAIDNAAGAPDALTGADDITGGPVPRFTFEYDSAMSAPGTVGVSSIRFDLGGGGGGGALPPGFDGLQYIASYADLAGVLGADRAAGEAHYLNAGKAEGRQIDLFSETQYLKNYGDLQAAFGHDADQATIHYINAGLTEGRTDDAAAPSQIDGLQYVASNPDLISAFGANAAAAQEHYAQFGQAENRQLDNFNESQYLRNYGDLAAAFGDNTDAATAHYIQFGFPEGRNDFIV